MPTFLIDCRYRITALISSLEVMMLPCWGATMSISNEADYFKGVSKARLDVITFCGMLHSFERAFFQVQNTEPGPPFPAGSSNSRNSSTHRQTAKQIAGKKRVFVRVSYVTKAPFCGNRGGIRTQAVCPVARIEWLSRVGNQLFRP